MSSEHDTPENITDMQRFVMMSPVTEALFLFLAWNALLWSV
jgi:hypothetical protein